MFLPQIRDSNIEIPAYAPQEASRKQANLPMQRIRVPGNQVSGYQRTRISGESEKEEFVTLIS
jgi:hypothetical protein